MTVEEIRNTLTKFAKNIELTQTVPESSLSNTLVFIRLVSDLDNVRDDHEVDSIVCDDICIYNSNNTILSLVEFIRILDQVKQAEQEVFFSTDGSNHIRLLDLTLEYNNHFINFDWPLIPSVIFEGETI